MKDVNEDEAIRSAVDHLNQASVLLSALATAHDRVHGLGYLPSPGDALRPTRKAFLNISLRATCQAVESATEALHRMPDYAPIVSIPNPAATGDDLDDDFPNPFEDDIQHGGEG